LFGDSFRIDFTFEMRTVLSGIGLFIDNLKLSDNIFISNGDGGEESKIEERQRERERRESEGSAWWKRRDSASHKMSF
jgi:hypothetical protein